MRYSHTGFVDGSVDEKFVSLMNSLDRHIAGILGSGQSADYDLEVCFSPTIIADPSDVGVKSTFEFDRSERLFVADPILDLEDFREANHENASLLLIYALDTAIRRLGKCGVSEDDIADLSRRLLQLPATTIASYGRKP